MEMVRWPYLFRGLPLRTMKEAQFRWQRRIQMEET